MPYFDTGTITCRTSCSPDKPYYTEIKECFRKCPSGYYKNPDSLACAQAGNSRTAVQRVSIQRAQYAYYARSATSYSEVDLNIAGSGSVSAFLEAQGPIMNTRLRSTTKGVVSYTPVIFFQGNVMIQCELQFTAPHPRGSAVLAVKLLNAISIFGCHLFTSFKDSGPYPSAISRNDYKLVISGSVIDIDGQNDESWFTNKNSGNVVYDGI